MSNPPIAGGPSRIVSMVDVLALLHLDVDADIVCVRHHNGASTAFRVAELIERDDVFVELTPPIDVQSDEDLPQARLWSPGAPASPISSIAAMPFASFVGVS